MRVSLTDYALHKPVYVQKLYVEGDICSLLFLAEYVSTRNSCNHGMVKELLCSPLASNFGRRIYGLPKVSGIDGLGTVLRLLFGVLCLEVYKLRRGH